MSPPKRGASASESRLRARGFGSHEEWRPPLPRESLSRTSESATCSAPAARRLQPGPSHDKCGVACDPSPWRRVSASRVENRLRTGKARPGANSRKEKQTRHAFPNVEKRPLLLFGDSCFSHMSVSRPLPAAGRLASRPKSHTLSVPHAQPAIPSAQSGLARS